ncbi:MAG: hypothetical protein E7266_06580 [Lachnospiraceae bacterium]|nr:hypothetical protein [Lachnospiraceae bacterium]
MILWLYGNLKKLTFPGDLIYRIEKQMNILYPDSKAAVIKKTIRILLCICILDIILAGILICMKVPLYYMLIGVVAIYVISAGYINVSFENLYGRLLEKQEKFISDLRYHYQLSPVIEDALQDTIYTSEPDMSSHGQLLLEYLSDENYGNESAYKEIAVNGYFMTLYALCNTVRIYGDKNGEKGSVFVENLGYLKEEIHIEMIKRRKTKSIFSGLTVMSIIPIFAIRPIELWSMSNMEGVTMHFESMMGKLITIILSVISLGAYYIVSKLKYDGNDNRKVKSRWVSLANKGVFRTIIVRYMSINYKKAVRLNDRLKEMGYIYNVKEYLFRKMFFAVMTVIGTLVMCIFAGFPVWWAVFSVPIVYIGMDMGLFLKEEIIKLDREEEVIRYQNIILMLMESENINIQMILEQMEIFAGTFRTKIEYLIDEYPYKGISVFEEVCEQCDFKPFKRLMESFIACDSISIGRAFGDIKSDRQYYVEKHKTDNEIIINNKGAVAKLVAMIPLYSVIIFKLIFPFVLEGLSMMNNIQI